MPSQVTFADGNTTTYTYDADGTKLRAVHKIGGTTTTTDYCGNVIYENGTAKCLLTEGGYLSLNDKKYHYYLQDHQGNNRVVASSDGSVEETNHYYPFGGFFAGTGNVQPYKYNGKELDAKKGLNWYDYGARMYDAGLGRFTTVDPMAERHYGVTPYSYCDNDPIGKIDPTGKDWIKDRYGSYLWDDEATDQETTRNGWNYIGTALPEGIDPYRILEERNGTLYHKNTSNPLASLVNLIAGKEVMVEKKAYDPAEDHMMQQFAETGSEFVIGEAAGKVVGKFVTSTIVRRIPQIGSKLDYVFGQATGRMHNIERSTTMLRQLESIGLFDNAIGRNYLKEHLKNTFKVVKGINQPNGRVLRESFLMGPNGGVKVESIWEENKLISIIIIGGK